MDIGEKVAFLKGLAEGLEISADSKNGKILKGILDVLGDMAEAIETLEDENETLEDYIEEIDEDLGDLETDYEKTCGYKLYAPHVHHKHLHNDFDDFEDDDDIYFGDDDNDIVDESEENEILDGVMEVKCPECKKRVMIDVDEIFESENMSVACPECGVEIEIIDDNGDFTCSECASCQGNDKNDEENENIGGDEDSIPF